MISSPFLYLGALTWEQLQEKNKELSELKELVKKGYAIVAHYKYKSSIEKCESDVKWAHEWQSKAEKAVGKWWGND